MFSTDLEYIRRRDNNSRIPSTNEPELETVRERGGEMGPGAAWAMLDKAGTDWESGSLSGVGESIEGKACIAPWIVARLRWSGVLSTATPSEELGRTSGFFLSLRSGAASASLGRPFTRALLMRRGRTMLITPLADLAAAASACAAASSGVTQSGLRLMVARSRASRQVDEMTSASAEMMGSRAFEDGRRTMGCEPGAGWG